MKSNFLILFLIISVLACSKSDPDAPGITPPVIDEPALLGDWKLVLEDNFDSDLSKWNIWEAGAFNNEIQLYRNEQLSIADGLLTITANRESVSGPSNPFESTPKNFQYVSGRIETKTQYGTTFIDGKRQVRIMARIKMPSGDGMWPAFWSYGDPWPTQGEIDIVEARGNEPMTFISNIFYGEQVNTPITSNTVVEHAVNVDITADFHVYELIWTADQLIIKFDDEVLHTYNANSQNYIASMVTKKQQVVLNVAVGGDFIPNKNPSTFVDTATMQVDWVKVYER